LWSGWKSPGRTCCWHTMDSPVGWQNCTREQRNEEKKDHGFLLKVKMLIFELLKILLIKKVIQIFLSFMQQKKKKHCSNKSYRKSSKIYGHAHIFFSTVFFRQKKMLNKKCYLLPYKGFPLPVF
jgi:hypothetical protein